MATTSKPKETVWVLNDPYAGGTTVFNSRNEAVTELGRLLFESGEVDFDTIGEEYLESGYGDITLEEAEVR